MYGFSGDRSALRLLFTRERRFVLPGDPTGVLFFRSVCRFGYLEIKVRVPESLRREPGKDPENARATLHRRAPQELAGGGFSRCISSNGTAFYSSGAGGGVGKPALGVCVAASGSGGTGANTPGPAWGGGAGTGFPGRCFGGRGGLPGLCAFLGCGLCGRYAGGGGPGVGCGGRTAQESRDSTNTRASSPQRNRRVFMAAKGMILSKCRELSACLAKNGRGFYLPGKRIPPIRASQRGEVSFILPGE